MDTAFGGEDKRFRRACFPAVLAPNKRREIGGGRASRQPGQVRKEAALTRSGSGRSSVSYFVFLGFQQVIWHAANAVGPLPGLQHQRGCLMTDAVQLPIIPIAAAAPYRVLARKYRPSSFDDLIGQEAVVRTVSNAFETGRIPQAWILTGVRGVGKTTTARILARALNYQSKDGTVDKPTIADAGTRRALPGDHGKPAHRRAGDGCRVAYRRR